MIQTPTWESQEFVPLSMWSLPHNILHEGKWHFFPIWFQFAFLFGKLISP